MKFYIRIESKGLIEEGAFTLLGASTKKGDNTKIGFFGSGLKYSIAYMLRHKIEFKVFSEYKEYVFTTKTQSFRDKEFDVICVNGKESSITTEAGEGWEAFFVLREIFSNALDEGESKISIVEDVVPIEDKTVFYIEATKDFQSIIDNWSDYFSEKRQDLAYADKDFNQIYTGGEKLIVYRKGIRCMFVENQKCIFNYDLDWVEINESRVIKSDWNFKYELIKFLKKIKDKKIIAQILNKINTSWERHLGWEDNSHLFTDYWVEVIGNKILVPLENEGYWYEQIKEEPEYYLVLPAKLIEGLKDRFLDKIKVIGDVDGLSGTGEFKVFEELTNKQKSLLDSAIDFLKNADYKVKYEIKIVDFIEPNRLGQAKDDTILLSIKLFEKGSKQVVACIIEEQEHLITGYNDESREFQNHFIGKYLSSLEDKTGKYL